LPDFILAIDQGTTSTRSMVFDAALRPVATAQQEIPQIYPAPGLVEHDPEVIWSTVLATMRAAVEQAGIKAGDVAALGITNQRETAVIWERATGRPIHNAIVWQDRRTAEACARLARDGHEPTLSARTGLLLDPYFSATKIAWMLDHVAGAREAANAGRLAFGTVDSFLLWRLTGGKVHATDATNAARTLLMDIHRGDWDGELCELFAIPMSLLPQVRDCAGDFGITEVLGTPIRIRGAAGDQQAATVGQGCFAPGMAKSTYGTGCFALLNTGATPVASRNRLLTTIAYQLGGRRTYALEGAIFVAGAAVQWLRPMLTRLRSRPIWRNRFIWYLHLLDWARRGGMPTRAVRCSGSPANRELPRLHARRWKRLATRRMICLRRCARIGLPRRAIPCCGLTAEWRRAMWRCSSLPTFSERRSIGPR